MTFYFKFADDDEELGVAFVEKEFFDKHGHLSDDFEQVFDILPDGFFELSECYFEFDCDKDEAKAKLLAAGFIENQDLF